MTVTGTLSSTTETFTTFDYPTNFTYDNCVCIAFEYLNASDSWRQGEKGVNDTTYRLFIALYRSYIGIYNSTSDMAGRAYRVTLMRTDI